MPTKKEVATISQVTESLQKRKLAVDMSNPQNVVEFLDGKKNYVNLDISKM